MPVFENIETNGQDFIDVEFEVYCATCGKGLCNCSETRRSYTRGYLQLTVEACPYCMSEKDKEIEKLDREIEELYTEIKELKKMLNES